MLCNPIPSYPIQSNPSSSHPTPTPTPPPLLPIPPIPQPNFRWESYVDYANRFNDNDLVHTTFWLAQGCGALVLLATTGAPADFGFAAATLHLILCGMYCRVAWHLPRCRPFISFHIAGQIATATLWVATSYFYSTAGIVPAESVVGWVAALGGIVTVLSITALLPVKHDLPLAIDYVIGKVGKPPLPRKGTARLLSLQVGKPPLP